MVSQTRKINCILSASNCLLSSIFFLDVLLLCSCPKRTQGVGSKDTLKHGERITLKHGETLVSSGGRFELGFFNATGSASNKSYVGIWYHNPVWDQKTFVWVANRDNPVLDGSTGVSFGIAEDGNLKVWDNTTGDVYWNTSVEISSSANRTAKLMDSGNLVLRDDQLATSLWETFQYPTDTFLPGMKMAENLMLISWAADGHDPGSGRFTFKQDQEGEGHYVISKKPNPLIYWKSSISDSFSSSNDQIPDYIVVFLSKVEYGWRSSDYTRLVMNYTGELQYWVVDKGNWSLKWREPEDDCSIYNYCGKFGSCNINNRLKCKCLPGFQPTYPKNWGSGDFLDGCTRNSTSYDKSDMFLSLKMMKVTNPEYISRVKNETECRNECLDSGQCQAYSYDKLQTDNSGFGLGPQTDICWIWTGDLTNLQEEYTKHGHNLSVRVAKSVIESTVRNCEPCGTNLIPYPLSTGPNCGERMYFSFDCNSSTGQVSFKAPSGTFRVASIDPSNRTFVIQVKHVGYNRNSSGPTQLLNDSLPFIESTWQVTNSNDSSGIEAEVHISWDFPKEPSCNSSRDCKDWPNSTCKKARDEMRRCLCKLHFQWNGSTLNCTRELVEGAYLQPSEEHFSKGKMSLTLIVLIPVIAVFVLASAIVCIYLWRRKIAKRQANRKSDERNRVLRTLDSERHLKDLMGSSEFKEEDEKDIDIPFFDLESILAATDSFSDAKKLGQGGYGPVYKGTFSGGQEIAVKRLSSVSGQGLQEFKNEVVLIAKLQHRNLVRLRGYCIKGDEKILLYEYMPNKSLDLFIFDQKLSMCLDWEMRANIILGIARGLLYLHHDSRLRIIHRDLKTSNILLDEEMNPKISDFGLARIVGAKETGANTTRVVGTYGYMSPEYALDGLFSVKSDVFSFGVVLLEIISGKKNTRFHQSEQAISLISYAWRLWVENKVLDLIDPALHEVCNPDQFVKCVNVGLLCVQEDPNDRPTMSNVVTMLDSEAATVPTPKQPAFVPWRGFSTKATSSSKPDSSLTEITSSLEEKHDIA